jgi:hypothetical protein
MLSQIGLFAKLRPFSVQVLVLVRITPRCLGTGFTTTGHMTCRQLHPAMVDAIIRLTILNHRATSTTQVFRHRIEMYDSGRAYHQYKAGERDFKEVFLGGVNLSWPETLVHSKTHRPV